MPNENLPLIGICKYCRRASAGQIVTRSVTEKGDAQARLFLCSECLQPPPQQGQDTRPGYWFYTFTTSNSSGSTEK